MIDKVCIFTDYLDFETAYKKLTEKCQPLVFELGFLRDSEKLN